MGILFHPFDDSVELLYTLDGNSLCIVKTFGFFYSIGNSKTMQKTSSLNTLYFKLCV